MAFEEWFLFDYSLDSGGTLAERFLERHARELRSGERRYLERLKREHREFKHDFPDRDLTASFKDVAMVYHYLWLDVVAPPPHGGSGDARGGPDPASKAIFDVSDPAALRMRLAASPEIAHSDDDDRYPWLEKVGDVDRVIGAFVLGGSRVVFEALSRERADRGRRLLESVAADLVRFRVTEHEDLQRATEHAYAEPEPPPIRPEIAAQAIAAFYDQHYRRWPDEPLPFLGWPDAARSRSREAEASETDRAPQRHGDAVRAPAPRRPPRVRLHRHLGRVRSGAIWIGSRRRRSIGR